MSSSSSSFQFSSSSSESSLSYSSSSAGFSSSSSSSGYCQYPDCSGGICQYLTNWRLVGVKPNVTNNGIIYVRTVYFSSTNTQQVELYQDPTYFEIIAIGQVSSLVATLINLEERNSSGVTGSVYWDATPLDYSYTGVVYCSDISSSSSSSSIDSSSESSISDQSSSSSSSGCCNYVNCEGGNCSYFSDWVFSGMGKSNSTNCTMYVGLFIQGSAQQVRVYKELGLVNLTAIGQRTGAGLITLVEQNNSGLSGTVTWDGTLLSFPNTLALSCSEFSSSSSSSSSSVDSSSSSSDGISSSTVSGSSSSSSSSIDSTSSSSSYGLTSSSSSSQSVSSSSSTTSESSSSSSSIDSSSTSSESIGNISSSSSSSGVFWNQTKPLLLGISAAANPNLKNRIAQTFKVHESTYNIGKVYVFLYRERGFSSDYYIRMSISDCNDDGSPKDELFLRSIHASTVTKDDWYAFDFDLTDETSPENDYLAITLRHNGNEDNFILWAYDQKNPDADNLAWTSNDSSTWEKYENAIFSLRIIENFDTFNSTNNTITTPPAPDPITITDPITDGKIEYPDAILSFVVDSSGSMGLMDRYNNRAESIQCLINKFKTFYPSDILFDLFTFGGSNIDTSTFNSNLGTFATINLDLNNPTRTTYIFTVSGSSADVGAVYENDDYEFTVNHKLKIDQTSLITYGSNEPIDSGTLNLVSGTGDSEISFTLFEKVSIDDPIISYGFKSLEDSHTYNIGELKVDFELINSVDLTNWQLFNPESESPTITLGDNAPLNAPSIDILASTNTITRKLFTNVDLYQSNITSIVYVGDTDVSVVDASGFSVGDTIDILEGNSANIGRVISEINGNTITFTPAAKLSVTNHSLAGSIVQVSTYNRSVTINKTTANILIRDVNTTTDIVFYLQNIDGYFMEWDFEAFDEWVSYNIFFFGDTARLPMSFLERDGTPFPNGTKVDIVVDKEPDIFAKNKAESVNISSTSAVGQTKIYLESTEGYFREHVIDILDRNGNIQTTKIEEVSEDVTGPYIEIADPLTFEVSTDIGSNIRLNETTETKVTPNDNLLSTAVQIVDVTPIVNDKDVDSTLLKPYDIERVPISTPYDDLNTAKEFTQEETLDMPTVDGNVCARVLPIVEDILNTVAEKEEDLSRLQRYSVDAKLVSQLEQNEGDLETATTLPTVDETTQEESVDYIIETPVYTNEGLATSSMQSFATEYSEKTFEGLTIPGIDNPNFFSKDYEIYASADFLGDSGKLFAKLYLDPFDISFLSPIAMNSVYAEEEEASSDNTFQVQYYIQDPNEEVCAPVYKKNYVRGYHASDGSTITLNYTVSDKFILANNKNMKIILYSNRIIDLEGVAQEIVYGSGEETPPIAVTEHFANIRPLTTFSTNESGEVTNQPSTAIDKWREIVTSNPFESIIESINEGGDTNQGQDSSYAKNVINQYADLLNATIDSGSQSSTGSLFYKDPSEWTLAKQFDQYEFTIPIVNGKATLEIPTNDVVSLLFVEASVPFGDQDKNEQILADMFFIANPITITGINPSSIAPAENELYEVGSNIEYLDNSETIEDNVQVNYSFEPISSNFRVEPSSSVTDSGWAGGVFIGPIEPIEPVPINPNADTLCPPIIEVAATVEVFHPSGYIRKVSRTVNLTGAWLIDENDFLFYAADATVHLYADSSIDNDAVIVSTLDDDFNPTDIFVGEDGILKLKGEGQAKGLPKTITTFNSSPRKTTWGTDGVVTLTALPRNRNIGHEQPLGDGQRFLEPWSSEVNAFTSYLLDNGNVRRGQIANGVPYPSESGGIITPKPIQKYKEPLGITVKSETNLVRNSGNSSRIYAELTWKGNPITNKLTINVGTEFESVIDYPFPEVTFESGTCKENNESGGFPPRAKDARNLIDGCLIVASHQDMLLSDYSVQSGLFRSDIYSEITNATGHTHDILIDENGDGITTSTIIISGSILNHTHEITSYIPEEKLSHTHELASHTHETVIDEDGDGTTTDRIILHGNVSSHTHTFTDYTSDEQLDHTHELRCVAITNILPTENIDTDFVVNGTVIYDPTNAEPFENEPSSTEGNRKMFATLYVPAGTALARRLSSRIEMGNDLNDGEAIFVLDYEEADESSSLSGVAKQAGSSETSPTFYTATDIEETIKGFDIRVFVKFPEYQYLDDNGSVVIVPEEIVPDGSRVTMELIAYKPEISEGEEDTDPGYLVMGAGVKRDYIHLKTKVSVTYDGYLSEREFTISIASTQQWFPSIKHQTPTLTADDVYLAAAINSFGFFGASQLHDAVKKAAEKLVQYQTVNEDYKDYEKFIILITDGDENTSENSLNQAVSSVDFVDGEDQIQIIPIQLGQPHISDSVLLEKYAEEGNSLVFFLNNSTSNQISSVCSDIISGSNLQINNTTLTGEIVFEIPNIPSSTFISGVTTPDNTEVTYRIRSSTDNIRFTDWSNWTDSAIPIDHDITIESIQKYVQYEVKIEGNSFFETPVINGGIDVNHYNPREFIIFFKEISISLDNDEYISSIHITSEADIPDNSTVNYLMTQSGSLKPEEYYNVIPDQHTILPTRFNEMLLTDDYKSYTAVNGRWNINSEVVIYRLFENETNGSVVNKTEYSANNIEGTITFLAPQDPSTTIFIDLFFASSFRIAAKVINYADDAAVIHHVGVMYNISKRIPRTNDGSIINVPISKRLAE